MPVHFSSLSPEMLMFTLAISCLTTFSLPWFMDLTFQLPRQYYSLQHQTTSITSHICNWVLCFALALFFHSFWSYFSNDLQQHIGHLQTWGVHLSVFYLIAFSYCSWGSPGKNTEVVCHSLFQWTTFCHNSPPWPFCLGWPHMAWLIVSLSWTKLWSLWSIWLIFCDCGFHSVCHPVDKDKRLMEAS